MAFELNLAAFRHAPWGGMNGLADLIRLDNDWSGAVFTWAFAASAGGPNAFTLSNAPEGSQGISASYLAGYAHPTSGEAVGGTVIRPQIDQVTLEAVLDTAPRDDKITLHHTLYVTPPGEPKRTLCFGKFTIKKGAVSQ